MGSNTSYKGIVVIKGVSDLNTYKDCQFKVPTKASYGPQYVPTELFSIFCFMNMKNSTLK